MAHPPSDDEGFASRWSRLKQRARDDKLREAEPPSPPAPVEAKPDERKAPEEEKKPFDISELPSVESLTKDSDYSGFMRAEVPEDLRQKALRKLWASDPMLSGPEILDMHNLDYNNVPTFPQGLKSLFRVGQGMLDALEAEDAEKQAAAAKPEGERPAAAKTLPESGAGNAASHQAAAVPPSETPEKSSKS
jgi:Protein of unknown function (DUF3306)